MKIFKIIEINPTNIKKNRWNIVKELGKSKKRGCILDVLELEGSYALENTAELNKLLSVGDKLLVCESEDAPNKDMLTVKTDVGTTVGFIPIGISLLPRLMPTKECKIYCYVEYKDFINDLLTLCVSMYTENY